mgnify:CR=1 FL=1
MNPTMPDTAATLPRLSLPIEGMTCAACAAAHPSSTTRSTTAPAARSAGALLYEQGKLHEALAFYEMALKVDPRDQEALKARKDLAARVEDVAVAVADAFVRLRPQEEPVDRLHGAAAGQQRALEASPDAQGVDFAPIHPPDIP